MNGMLQIFASLCFPIIFSHTHTTHIVCFKGQLNRHAGLHTCTSHANDTNYENSKEYITTKCLLGSGAKSTAITIRYM